MDPAARPTDPEAPAGEGWGPNDLPGGLRPYLLGVHEQYLPDTDGTSRRFALSASTTPNLNVTLEGAGAVVMPAALGGRTVPLDAFSLAPPMAYPYAVEAHGAVRGLDVLFHPVGPFALLGVTDYRLSAAGVPPLEHVVRPDLRAVVREWRRAVLAPPPAGTPPGVAFATRARLIVEFLVERAADVPPAAELLQRAVAQIEEAEGNVRIVELAEALGVSHPTLRRRFRVLGLSVKGFAQIVRFRHAHAFLTATPGATWADVAHRYGYADQSHFVREHRRFSGVPPTRWADADRLFDERLPPRTPATPPAFPAAA